MSPTDPLQYVTLAIAIVGAVLGVLTTWRTFNNDRLRVKVNCSLVLTQRGGPYLGVDVINLSSFPITITHFGYFIQGTTRHAQFLPIFPHGETMPVRLEPRTRVTALASPDAANAESLAHIDCFYVNTACGNVLRGRRKSARQLVENFAAALQR